jgi:GNAT superfamily N-acetyltransferase
LSGNKVSAAARRPLEERMTIKVESPGDQQALTEFIMFHDRVYAARAAHWPAIPEMQLPLLLGQAAGALEKRMRALAVRDGDEIVARVLAVIDERYQKRWNEPLGHLTMFEALPGRRDAVRQLLDTACEWLRAQGADAARAGYLLPLDSPFAVDEYGLLPPSILRQNPGYYHALLKDAGFETEKGMVDYKIEVTPELIARYESALEAARRGGFDIVALREVAPERRVLEFAPAFNEAFWNHWGQPPSRDELFAEFFSLFEFNGGLDTSVIAYRRREPVGTLLVAPEDSPHAVLAPGRTLADAEKLNFLGIGVRETARGRGVNLAMAAYAYLELIRRGAKFLSYTLVLDDNWPSRRTAEKLGANVCANYVAYRRNFRR